MYFSPWSAASSLLDHFRELQQRDLASVFFHCFTNAFFDSFIFQENGFMVCYACGHVHLLEAVSLSLVQSVQFQISPEPAWQRPMAVTFINLASTSLCGRGLRTFLFTSLEKAARRL